MTPTQAVPDAVAPILAAVMQQHPAASPETLARLAVAELRALGWHITPGPTRRPCPGAAPTLETP
ncbi:hypothetical protein ACF1DW_04270 [Streptomyces sp. NPDC014603]|uniref:hypothetical protein n=1 Tax=Streptomyces sp. NPDC014603 TaxID=3364873 RepID=UPI0036F66BF9